MKSIRDDGGSEAVRCKPSHHRVVVAVNLVGHPVAEMCEHCCSCARNREQEGAPTTRAKAIRNTGVSAQRSFKASVKRERQRYA